LIDLARSIAARGATPTPAAPNDVKGSPRKTQLNRLTTTTRAAAPSESPRRSADGTPIVLPAIEPDLARGLRQQLPHAPSTVVPLDDQLSARRVITTPQKFAGIATLAIVVASVALWPLYATISLIALASLIYASAIAYKGYLGVIAMTVRGETPVDPAQVAALTDEVLPVYTVILPLYRETAVLDGLVQSITALDYPTDKLDVKLLLEEDDIEMQRAVAALSLPAYFERLIVPDIGPQGKPRACNYGLSYARGRYLALYDAEDRPEPDQLKKALVAFAVGGQNVACVQAKLNFYNPDQNLLTKWFTIEYSTWFDLYLPALNSIGAPIPLGGTSNHFRVDQLRAIGAWDPYNVTEDADLGLRLARYHLRTSVIDSTTYEEANSRLGNWLRQRSRWVKGYMQTWLVHMRHPLILFSDLGAAGFFAFQVMVFGTFFTYFVNPLFWGLVIAWYATHAAGIEALFPAPVLYLSAFAFFAGNFVFIFTTVAGSLQRGFYHGVKYALINHIYWALMSIASWKALAQLIRRPHYWEKTQHGLNTVPAPERAGGAR
jgi:cellulose synthase/poly-beta-1,6-N-acetylglucosamine synthase-like glycosyltransferase